MKGSVLIMDFPDQAALDAYIAAEPYAVEHVWEKIEIEQLNIVILNPKFQSTHPIRGETPGQRVRGSQWAISIHSPHTG